MAQQQQKAKTAFDMWLDRGLHDLYDGIAREPLPADLLRLLDPPKKR